MMVMVMTMMPEWHSMAARRWRQPREEGSLTQTLYTYSQRNGNFCYHSRWFLLIVENKMGKKDDEKFRKRMNFTLFCLEEKWNALNHLEQGCVELKHDCLDSDCNYLDLR